MRLLFLICFVFGLQAQASSEKLKSAVESLSACGNFIRFDNDYVYTGFGPYWTSSEKPRKPRVSVLLYKSINQLIEKQINTLDSVVDVVKHGSSTYILTYSGIEEWDLEKSTRLMIYKTYPINRPFEDGEHPQAFALYNDQLIVAHGRLGVSFLDLKTKRLVRTLSLAKSQLPLESTANGVTVSGPTAYVVLDSYSVVGPREQPAFQGIVKINMSTESLISELDGLGAGAESIVSDGKVAIVSFYGSPLTKFSLNSLNSEKLPSPLTRLFKFPIDGYPVGKGSMDEKYYFTCFKKAGTSSFNRVPLVLSRQVLRLN